MNWLVQSFFRLHRRRDIQDGTPRPLTYWDIDTLATKVLRLPNHLMPLFVNTMEATDDAVLEYLFSKNAAKLKALENQKPRGRKHE